MNTQRRAFTLTEVLVATTLAGLILAGVMGAVLFILRSSHRVSNYNEMETEVSRALEVLAREVRMATSINGTLADPSVDTYTLAKIRLRVPDEETDPANPAEYQVDYWYRTEPNGRLAFVRQTVGASTAQVLVRNVDPAHPHAFLRYDRAPGYAINDYSTNQIQVSMTVQPDDKGLVVATAQRVVSAYFVLRNR